jgi:serine/threonine protein kinase
MANLLRRAIICSLPNLKAMDPTRWRQMEKIFHDVIGCEPEPRMAFLDDACAGDSSLKNDILVLLRSDEANSGFLTATSMSTTGTIAGKTFGSYQIKTLIGAGGMGEVYRAWESKLKRDVAIKVLPNEFSRNPERVLRFQRELLLLRYTL